MKWNELPSKGPMTRERDDSGRRGVLASLNRFVVASFARFAIFFLFFLLLLLFFCAAAVKSANPTANHCQKYQRNFNRFWNRRLIRFNFSCDDIRWYWHRRQICIATLKLDWIFKRQKKKKKKMNSSWFVCDVTATKKLAAKSSERKTAEACKTGVKCQLIWCTIWPAKSTGTVDVNDSLHG